MNDNSPAWQSLNMAQTHASDAPLLKKLGLKTFKGATWQQMELGTTKMKDGSWVKVAVTCAPAQFWDFEVYCADSRQTTKFSTGSGSFRQYWPLAEAIAQGMVVLDSTRIQADSLAGFPIKRTVEPMLEEIAKQEFGVETLATRNSDGLDFYDISVASMKRALLKAYEAGTKQRGSGHKM